MDGGAVTARGRNSRQRIIEAAAEQMATRGVEGTNLDTVLAAANAGKSQLYHYFSDKEALVRAVVAYRVDTVVRDQAERLRAVAEWGDVHAIFLDIVAGQIEQSCRIGCPVGSLAAELSDRDDGARLDLVAAFDEWDGALRQMLEGLRVRGLLATDADIPSLATATLATIQGGLLLSKISRNPERLRTSMEQAYESLRRHATT